MAADWEIAAHLAYNIFWYGCLIANLVFSHLGFWSGIFFLIVPFSDHCLLVPSSEKLHFQCKWRLRLTVVANNVANKSL